MNTEIYAELKGDGKQQPVFEGILVQAELRETLAVTTITQTYSNQGKKNIEAVYTFPLPLDAVLLDMIVSLGDKTLKGTVLPKQEAEAKYEDAITEGDAPVMLQNPQPGVYTMNVGNLLPGEKAQITLRYGMFMRWQGNTLRYHLPTTIAPRYGSAERAGLEAQQEPETSLLVDNLFGFEMRILGTMAGMAIESPSHDIAVEKDTDGSASSVRLLKKSAFMDRDLIVTVRRDAAQAASVIMTKDGEEYLLWGSFQPQFGLSDNTSPRSVKIVVDCSGSMGGDSIAQAREALLRVLDELRPQDWFNIVAFGDRAVSLFNAQTKADKESLNYARGYLKKLDADMGGTEIGTALDLAVKLRCPDNIPQDVLLITDGEIWEWEKVAANATKTKHRFFTVGVGSAVSEAFVKELAEQTGGVCELVSPNENMAERIHSHFKRMSTPRFSGNDVTWPAEPASIFPEKLPGIYDGDTVNLFAWFTGLPVGDVCLNVALPDKTSRVLKAQVSAEAVAKEDGVVQRMAAALKMKCMTDAVAGQELAVKYQLVSRWTNYLAVVVRDDGDKAETLPELQKVQQMMAAGWGGTGSVMYSSSGQASRMKSYSCAFVSEDAYDKPTFLRSSPFRTKIKYSLCDAPPPPCDAPFQDDEPYDSLEDFIELLDTTITAGGMPKSIHLPLLPTGIETTLESLTDDGIDEQTVVTVFLHHLAGTAAGNALSRQAKRIITKAYKDLIVDMTVIMTIEECLQSLGTLINENT